MTTGYSNQHGKSPRIHDRRAQIVLSAVVSEHLLTGEPVGSKTLSEKYASTGGWSSATIRNIMSELEEDGYLEQPHTSAGRIPTDKGYRYYVDNLLNILSICEEDLNLINEGFNLSGIGGAEDYENLPEKTSKLLSAISQNIGIVISPGFAQDLLQHINFVNLSDKRILVVLVSAPNTVHNRIIKMHESFTQEELDKTARYLNAEFAGKSLSAIRNEILHLMHEEKTLFDKMLQTAMILCSQSIEGEQAGIGGIYIDGTSNILNKPDFADFGKLRELLRTIEEKSRLVKVLNECLTREQPQSRDVRVIIGSEHSSSSMQNCTLITAPYHIGTGDAVGTLSVLGPTRIEYARLIAIVGYIAKTLERKLLFDE